MQPLPFPGFNRLQATKKLIDRICNRFVAERKSAFLREQSSEVKERSDTTRRDLLTLLVQANLLDADGMSDSDVRARKGSPRALSAPHYLSSRNLYLPHRWPQDGQRCSVLEIFWPLSKSGGSEKTPGRAFGSPHG